MSSLVLQVIAITFALAVATANDTNTDPNHNDREPRPKTSPVRGIEGHRGTTSERPRPDDVQSIDGVENNRGDGEMGAIDTPLLRTLPSDYADGISELAGAQRPGARTVSNAVHDQLESTPNTYRASDYLWQWGQFVDHDIDLTDGTDPPELKPIPVAAGDPFFDPDGSGVREIAFNRSAYDPDTGLDVSNPRQQINQITSWIDASQVYGSDAERADELRSHDGTGRLKTSDGNLLPFNENGFENAGGASSALFLAGDVRANEQAALTAMHTLFVREHNRQAARIALRDPQLDGERIYQRARRIVIAQMQVITYREFLPVLLGRNGLPPYRGYRPEIDARISNAFSAAAYRFGHSALSPTLLRLDQAGEEIAAGHLALRDAFFNPSRITDEGGIDPLLRGLARQVCQAIDVYVVDDVRNFLFGQPGSDGFDLAALNIQRGRDHGLPNYNDAREILGFERADDFEDITDDPTVQARLSDAYGDVEEVDLWSGGLAEPSVDGGQLGPLFGEIVADQFAALRDGDRFWYARVLSPRERRVVERTRLSDIIRRNTSIGREIQDDVFRVPGS